jgi:hypothetical protein
VGAEASETGEWSIIMDAEQPIPVPALWAEALRRLISALSKAGATGGRVVLERDGKGCTVSLEAPAIDCADVLPQDSGAGTLDPDTNVDARVAWWLVELCDGDVTATDNRVDVALPTAAESPGNRRRKTLTDDR